MKSIHQSGRFWRSHQYADGFTLIELVITIALVGIIYASLSPIINQFMNAYQAEVRRGELVDRAQIVLGRVSREVRLALPDSIRVDAGGTALELIRTLDGGRYRSYEEPGTDALKESEDPTDDEFDTIGKLVNCAQITTGTFLTMNNAPPGSGPGDAYQGVNVAPVISCGAAADGVSSHIIFNPAPLTAGTAAGNFVSYSGLHRFQVIDTPVSYVCANNEIRRYDGYPISATQYTDYTGFSSIPGFDVDSFTSDIIVDDIVDCTFTFTYAVLNKSLGVVTINVTIKDPDSDERVTLMQQTSVVNGI